MAPKIIEARDTFQINGLYLSQKINPLKDEMAASLQRKISYGGDDHARSYQIYRLPEMPSSYTDFARNLHATLYEPISSYVDSIRPNQKYYYTFRVFDSHGNFSNPTHIYEVEMVSNDGIIYPIMKVYSEQEVKQKTIDIKRDYIEKQMKRYLLISPTFAQGLIDSADANQDKITLGQKSKKIFGRKFKIRLSSRSTGKKIDLNIKFKQKHLVNEIEGDAKKT